MSGINGDRFELTATRALYWDRRRGCCRSLVEVGERHLGAFSWEVGNERGNWLAVRRPDGLTDRQFEEALWRAVTA